jgi:glycine cleavage system H lipoate-binding protein
VTGVRAGITAYARDEPGEIVCVDLPETDTTVEQAVPPGRANRSRRSPISTLPVCGRIVERNDRADTRLERLVEQVEQPGLGGRVHQ